MSKPATSFSNAEPDFQWLYMGLKLHPDVRVTWFTCEADTFFGPAYVQRVANGTGDMREVEVVSVDGASHGDIFMWTGV